MKTTALILLAALAASCGAALDDEPVKSAATCVLDAQAISQPARVMSASSADPECADAATSIAMSPDVVVERGRLFGLPLKLTSVTSYDGTSFAARCVYDVRGFVEARPNGLPCAVIVDVLARVVVK